MNQNHNSLGTIIDISLIQMCYVPRDFNIDQLTEAGLLHRVAVVVIDFVTLFAVVSDDSLCGAVATTALVVARRCLVVALARWKRDTPVQSFINSRAPPLI